MKTNVKVLLFAAILIIAASCGVKVSQTYYDQKPQIISTELDGSMQFHAGEQDEILMKL